MMGSVLTLLRKREDCSQALQTCNGLHVFAEFQLATDIRARRRLSLRKQDWVLRLEHVKLPMP